MNLVVIQGYTGNDPQVTDLDSGSKVATFSVATTERGFKTADGKEVPDRTEWHRIVCWNGLATIVQNYLKKGSQITIQGKLQTRSWEDESGVKRYVTEIVADKLTLPPKGNGGGASIPPPEPPVDKVEKQAAPKAAPKTETKAAPKAAPAPVVVDSEEELPF